MKFMMKKILQLKDKLFIPTSILFVCFFLLYDKVGHNWGILILTYIILGLGVFFIFGGILELFDNTKVKSKRKKYSGRDMIGIVYFYSEYIINLIFYLYFFLYVILMLTRKSIIFDYLLLIIYGMFLGYRLAVRAYYYLKERENIDK